VYSLRTCSVPFVYDHRRRLLYFYLLTRGRGHDKPPRGREITAPSNYVEILSKYFNHRVVEYSVYNVDLTSVLQLGNNGVLSFSVTVNGSASLYEWLRIGMMVRSNQNKLPAELTWGDSTKLARSVNVDKRLLQLLRRNIMPKRRDVLAEMVCE